MATPVQTPPRLATEYSREQRRQIDETVREVSARWRRMGPRFDSSWALIAGATVALVRDAQVQMIDRAAEYVPAVMEDTRQTRAIAQSARPNHDALIGWTGGGVEVGAALSVSTIRAKQAVGSGQSATAALVTAGQWLALATTTILADTARSAESLESYTRNVGGYVRMVNGGACGRCVILAGKFYRKNQGFLRHPRCRCVHIPASEALGSDWSTNPREYFDSLTDEQQIKLMGGKANAQAVRDGADMGQIVNAYHRTGGLRLAQSPLETRYGMRWTTAGTTSRSRFYQQQVGLGARRPLPYGSGRSRRMMPESIYRAAGSRDEALAMLRHYGWIDDVAARSAGRSLIAEQQRIARNARARERRRQQRLERLDEMARGLRRP